MNVILLVVQNLGNTLLVLAVANYSRNEQIKYNFIYTRIKWVSAQTGGPFKLRSAVRYDTQK